MGAGPSRRERRTQELLERKDAKKRRKELERSAHAAGSPVDALEAARREDAEARARSGEELAREGHYEWLASQLPDAGDRLALEVGTTGASTVALRARGFRVVAIDENAALLARAAERGGELSLRGRARAASPGMHAIAYEAPPSELHAEITFVEADVVAERDLGDALVYAGPFDVVTSWSLAAHGARFANEALAARGVRDLQRYRGEALKRVYELADKVLYSDGVLQVVHALDAPMSEELAREVVRLHGELAKGTSLRFERMDVRAPFVAVRARKT